MIFVTVGTHEQPFNRLVEAIDKLKEKGTITEEVIVQTGFSTYKPQHCIWSKMFAYQDMCKFVEQARIVITHGGPSSFIMPLQIGKIPIVVPRQKMFGEHVNDHQLVFAQKIAQQWRNILVVEEIENLEGMICDYNARTYNMQKAAENHNAVFCAELEEIVLELLGQQLVKA